MIMILKVDGLLQKSGKFIKMRERNDSLRIGIESNLPIEKELTLYNTIPTFIDLK